MLLILTATFLWEPVFTGRVLLPGGYLSAMEPWKGAVEQPVPQWNALQWDAVAEFYPWRLHYARSMGQGIIPFWNPYQFSGTPFAANGQSAVFYPLNLLFVLFGPLTGFTAGAFIHLLLAGVFTFLLARRLDIGIHSSVISAIIFAFSAFMIVWLELPTFVNVAAWLPLILYLSHLAVERGSKAFAAWAGAAAGMCILAGHLQIAFYCWFTAALWWGWLFLSVRKEGMKCLRKAAACAVVAVVIAVLMAAPQLLPTLELVRDSHRTRPISIEGYHQFTANGIPAWNLITMLVPDFYGNPSRGTYWFGNAAVFTETALYIGIMSLFLAVMGGVYALRRRGHPVFFLAAAVVSLLLAFGTWVNLPFFFFIPGFSSLGGPNRIIIVYTLAAALLAGFGADWVGGACASPDSPACDRTGKLPVWSVAPALAGVTGLFLVSWFVTDARLQQLAGVRVYEAALVKARPALLVFTVFFTASALLLLIRAIGGLERRVFLRIAMALIAVDLLAFGVEYNPTVPRDAVYPETPGIAVLKMTAASETIAVIDGEWSLYQVPNALMPPNAAMVYQLYDAGGYDSLFSRQYKDRVDELHGGDTSPQENGNMVFFKRYVPELKKIASVFVSKKPLDDPELTREYDNGFYIYRVGERPLDQMSRQMPENPNRVESSDVRTSNVNYPGWKPDRGGLKYEPNSIKLGIFLALLGTAMTGFFVAGESAVRRGR